MATKNFTQKLKEKPEKIQVTTTSSELITPNEETILPAAEPPAAAKDKKDKKWLRLDITDYNDYLKLITDHQSDINNKYISVTRYIQDLIAADQDKNKELYKKLQDIEKLKKELI